MKHAGLLNCNLTSLHTSYYVIFLSVNFNIMMYYYYIEYSDGVRREISPDDFYILKFKAKRDEIFKERIDDFSVARIVHVDYDSKYANLPSHP